MSDLLIHSMAEFADIILDALDIAEARHLVEIGAEYGGMSKQLADFAAAHGGTLTSIDPAPKPEFLDWVRSCPNVRHCARPSLDVIPELERADAWVIDGDHNYFTVYHELKAADAIARRDGRPLLAILHDVGWPSGRRDMYYAPDRIPAEWRHPHDWTRGAHVGRAELADGGFRGCGSFAWALHEGGPRNGVLTAVEDFRAEAQAEGRDIALAVVPAVFGLGILFDSSAPWSGDLALRLLPLHGNALLASLEENRLRNYLKVLELQDRLGA